MKKIIYSIPLLILLASCNSGDDQGPGTPLGFRFVCDSVTLESTCATPNTRSLLWVASGDDGDVGRAMQYDARWATMDMTASVFDISMEFIAEPLPQPAGTQEIWFLPRMLPGTPLSFGLRAYDEVAVASGVTGTTLVNVDYMRTPITAGASTQPGFGSVVELLGDLNWSLYNDFAISAPGAVEPISGNATGAVYVYLNMVNVFLLQSENGFTIPADGLEPTAVIYGEAAGDQFGASVSGEFDFNGDYLPDFVVGAPGAGKAYVFFGGDAGSSKFTSMNIAPGAPVELYAADADVVIIGPAAGFGASVAGFGDLNAVTVATAGELVIGSPSEGAAYLFYGGLTAGNAIAGTAPVTLDMTSGGEADWKLIGPAGSDFGATVARVSNIDGGIEDIAIASPGLDLVYLFFGGAWADKALDMSLAGPITHDLSAGAEYDLLIFGEAGSQFGASIDARRDHYGIGYATMFIGAPGSDTVFAFHGGAYGKLNFPRSASDLIHDAILDGADRTYTGNPGTNFGAAIEARADLDGDFHPDVLIGAPDESDGTILPGAVYQYITESTDPVDMTAGDAEYILWGATDLGGFGSSLADGGELVGHPAIVDVLYFDDFLVGAPGADSAFTEY